jgi:hypothetical protein
MILKKLWLDIKIGPSLVEADGWQKTPPKTKVVPFTLLGSPYFLCIYCFPEKKSQKEIKTNAPVGNRTRVCTVAGYYSTTRPLVLDEVRPLKVKYNLNILKLCCQCHCANRQPSIF